MKKLLLIVVPFLGVGLAQSEFVMEPKCEIIQLIRLEIRKIIEQSWPGSILEAKAANATNGIASALNEEIPAIVRRKAGINSGTGKLVKRGVSYPW